ncbi:MAG: cell division protein SepF [Oscillospiraceae bacterium]|jgi:cell division inhibitor SepF
MGFFDGLVNNIRDLARPYNDDDDFERDFAPEDVIPPTPVTVQEPAKPKVRTFGRSFHRGGDAEEPSDYFEAATASEPKRAAYSQPASPRTSVQPDVKLTKPESFIRVKETAEYLRNGYVVIVNLQDTPNDEARRILDFLSGFAYAQNGNVERAAEGTYTITPSNVSITRDSNEDLKSGSVTL